MPTQSANSPFSQAPLPINTRYTLLAHLILGTGLAVLVLLFGFLVWRVAELSHSRQPAAQQRVAPVQPAPAPLAVVAEVETESEAAITAAPSPLPNSGEKQEPLDKNRKELMVKAPPPLPDAKTLDQLFEQRLRASEADLREQLRDVPEVRLLSDDQVKNVRKDEMAVLKPTETAQIELNAATAELNAARARLDAARADLNAGRMTASAYDGAARTYQEDCRRYDEVARRYRETAKRSPSEREKERIGYDFSLRLHRDMKRAAVQAGLELGSGPNCELAPAIAAQVAKLSKDLRDKGFVNAPGVPSARTIFAQVAENSKKLREMGLVNVPGVPAESADGRTTAFQAWCDQHGLELMSGAVPTLTQMLQIEDEATRLLLVRELTRSRSDSASVELALRALVDLSPAVRRAALAGLEKRPSPEYVPVLLRGLSYPWPPVADHAAVALRTLKPQKAVAPLVDLLDLPSPSAPVYDAQTKQYTVREMVRLNHLRNCLLCHAPARNKNDGLVRGLVPTPGQPLPNLYYESQDGDFVCADITFLRQDFSINLPDKDAGLWPSEQRYDFVTRLRTVPPSELAFMTESSANYPQRDAVLYALRGLTGKDGGDSTATWRELVSLPAGGVVKTKDASLDRISQPPREKSEKLDKSVISTKGKNAEP